MHVMEGRVGSGVLKKKSSSGCLIIKKAGASKNSGGGLGGLGDSSSKGGKRDRLVSSGSDSSSSSSSDDDECLEFMRRKVNEKRLKGSTGNAEKKRSRLDLFEFDEYDEFDGKKMRNEFTQDRWRRVERNDVGNVKESTGTSNRNLVADKRKHGSYFNGSSIGRSKNAGCSGTGSKGFGSSDDEANMPISLLKMKYKETAGESIRLQGKNGVLKVMVNKKKKMDFPSQHKNREPLVKDSVVGLPVNPDSKTAKSPGLLVGKERSGGKEKEETKLEKMKPTSVKNRKARDSGVDVTDIVLAMPTPKACSSKKAVKKESERSPSTEISPPVKGKEGKEGNTKRGGSTEKQMLREKIRGMLIDAGWSIDYRPRRNRDYLDAVYINPSGTAYWSIIKAYDAFKKHLEEDNDKVKAKVGSPSLAPISEDLISKLTRQTKKKIAEEIKRKRQEDSMTKSTKKSAVKEAEESSDSDQSEERLSSYMKQNKKLRKKLCKVDQGSDSDSSDDSLDRRPKKVKFEKTSTSSKSIPIQGRTSKVIGRCTLLVRGSDQEGNSEFDGYVPYKGKRTVLAWLIDCGTAKLSEKVQYMNRRRTKVMLEGWITREGIHCGCCSKILTVSKFEIHAGSKLRQPFQNIFLESGSSLLQCQIDAWNSQEESLRRDFVTVNANVDDPDDDTCGICGDGGDLICCDGCPSTFHQICLGIQMLPSGDWHCPNCICKYCGLANENTAEEIDISDGELNRCNFCDKKYHNSCSERAHPQPNSCITSFCGLKCQEIYDHLQKILGTKHELEAGISWSIIQRSDVSDASQRGFPSRVECNSKLAVALSVMDECFLPIIDRRSGINIIHNVVYNCGSNFNRLNYRGFYTAIMERGDEILAAASIRLHGDRLAEMPFIGTREIYRRQGMCRRLLSSIETELGSLNVKQLIIPAISERMNTWTDVFGFHELEGALKKEIKSMNMLVFPGTDMLQKQLAKKEKFDGAMVSEPTMNQPPLLSLVEKSEASLSEDQNTRVSSDSGGCPTSKSCDEVDALDSESPIPSIPSDSVSEKKQKESSDNLKCSSIPAGDGNHSDEGHRSLEPPSDGDSFPPPVEAVEEDACKIEDSTTPTCSEKASEDATLSKTASNGCAGSLPASVSDISVEVNNGASNGDDEESVVPSIAHLDVEAFDAKTDGVDPGVVQDTPDHAESDKPDRDARNDGVSPDVIQDTPDRAESDANTDGVNPGATLDAPDSNESDELDTDAKADGVVEDTSDDAQPDRDAKNDGVSPDVVQDTPDRVESDAKTNGVDPPVAQDAHDRDESDKPETDAKADGVVQDTPDRAESDQPDGDAKTDGVPGPVQDAPDHAESNKPTGDAKSDPGVIEDTPDRDEKTDCVDPGIVEDTPDRDEKTDCVDPGIVEDTPDRDEKTDCVDVGIVEDTPDCAETDEHSSES
ncbi:uncharacterized protein LOC125201790 [Salvia hispanica]|uniref:uncharacterized protein LOC125201790 n=1 Tax=Salvia hispanica TaxID=49212 RepID=UPI002009A93E|nr:uncharacterized protein LOC125201790 [Salvia hispanica]XP_047955999.1 uncharacterized protein LOC125201790 [Salvia hispanica]